MTNKLYYGDNLGVLREHIADASVDLVYLDPPFNSNATYNVLFKAPDGHESQAQIEAFDDTWHWTLSAEQAYAEVMEGPHVEAAKILEAMRGFLGENDLMAYLAMMAIRLIELHRVLKPTGSLYLHCDPTASHYLKILVDGIFGGENFRSEVHWYYYNKLHDYRKKLFSAATDTILFYVKDHSSNFTFNVLKEKRDKPARQLMRKKVDGRAINARDADGKLMYQIKEDRGIDNVWRFPMLQPASPERLGYPTQKPVALLERILSASSNPGDVVLDPFCGCGTTVHAAQKLGRQWIGIDVTHLAIGLIERRLRDTFGKDVAFQTYGVPKDVAAARDLAERDKNEFEKWAVALIPGAVPYRTGKGADGGIDGIVRLKLGKSDYGKAIVEVKGGGVSVDQIHKLKSVVEREKALTGVFVTLNEPTKPMIAEAAAAGFAATEHFGRVPVVQIITIRDILESYKLPRLPGVDEDASFKKAPKEKQGGQGALDL